MNIFFAGALGLHRMYRESAVAREDKITTVCAQCETENYREAACCKACGHNYLIPRAEFRAMREEAQQKREGHAEARRALSRLRDVRQCDDCQTEFSADHAFCTICGNATAPLDAGQVFTRMKKRHGRFVHAPEDLELLATARPSDGKGLLASVRDWWTSL